MSGAEADDNNTTDQVPVENRWNHNIALHRGLLAALPDPCGRALDAGCGDGVLTWSLAERAGEVVAIDLDPASVERTAALVKGRGEVEVRQSDLMTDPELEPGSFDGVMSIAVLHHLELLQGLARLASLVRPGGVLAIGGLARSRTGYDLAFDVAGAVRTRIERRRHGWWEIGSPMTDPRQSYAQVLRTASLMLPGVSYRRHALFRYTLVWTRPDDWTPPEISPR